MILILSLTCEYPKKYHFVKKNHHKRRAETAVLDQTRHQSIILSPAAPIRTCTQNSTGTRKAQEDTSPEYFSSLQELTHCLQCCIQSVRNFI